MIASRVCAAILAIALADALVPAQAGAAENPSYAAYAQGRYLTALKLAEQEAAQGSKEAFTLMGEIYSGGLGVAQDYGKAADAYAKASDLGDANAQLSLGLMVAEGIGVKKDLRLAAGLFEKAAENGNPAAQYNLALVFLAWQRAPCRRSQGRPMDGKGGRGGQCSSAIRLGRALPIRPRRADRQKEGGGVDGPRGGRRPRRCPGRVRQ